MEARSVSTKLDYTLHKFDKYPYGHRDISLLQ